MGAVRQAAHDLERALERLVCLLEARDTPAEALEDALRACAGCFEVLRTLSPGGDAAERAELTRVLRANAFALDLAGATLEGAATGLERVRTARRQLAAQRGPAPTGDSCDIEG